jgi:hypothetical protein
MKLPRTQLSATNRVHRITPALVCVSRAPFHFSFHLQTLLEEGPDQADKTTLTSDRLHALFVAHDTEEFVKTLLNILFFVKI